MKRIMSRLLCAALIFALAVPVLAAESRKDIETAAAALTQQGILKGDENGDLNLDSGLSRAELAVILTRLSGDIESVEANPEMYERDCIFTDVPQWAKRYVGYCAGKSLVNGYGGGKFGASDPVSPAQACTVVLRRFGFAEGEGKNWSYSTACSYAAGLGLLDMSTTRSAAITRGETAVLIYRAMKLNDTVTNLTEESVQATLWSLMDVYPIGTTYETPYRSTSNGPYNSGTACAGWATLCSDMVFGGLPWRRVTNPDWETIRPGDLVRYDNAQGGHVVVVLERADDYIIVTESGLNNKARWGGQYFKWWLEEQPGYALYTRYPD